MNIAPTAVACALIGAMIVPLSERLGDLPAKYLVAAAALGAGVLLALMWQRHIERAAFLLFVVAVPIRAAALLGQVPTDVATLASNWATAGAREWVGATMGIPSIALSDIPLLVLVCLAFLRPLGRPLRDNPRLPLWLIAAGLVFAAAELASMVNAEQSSLAFWTVVETLKAIVGAGYVIYRTRTKEDLDYLIGCASVAVLLESVIAIAQFASGSTLGLAFSGVEWPDYLPGTENIRVSGTFAHPQMLAMYLGFFLPLLSVLPLTRLSHRLRTWYAFVFACGLITMVLTFSRMGWLASAAALTAVMAAYAISTRRHYAILSLAVPITLIVVFLLGAFGEPIMSNLTIERAGSPLDIVADLYRVAFAMIEAQPLIGIGVNNFSYSMRLYDPTGVWSVYPAPVHNLFLLVTAETGLIGLSAFLAVVAMPTLVLVRSWRSADPTIRSYAIGLSGGILVFFLLSLTGWTYYTIQVQTWFYLGVVLSLAGLIKKAGLATGAPNGPSNAIAARGLLDD